LSRDYRVIAVSRRFHWPNRRLPVASTIFEAQSADLDALLQSLGRPPTGRALYGAGVALLTA
jgi:hypothetical protein